MANYAIGDIQGCYDELRLLLNKIKFNPAQDTLWLAGDLVSRGPKSLQTLQYLYQIQDSCEIVLGNHDLHLLAAFYTGRKIAKRDKLHSLLEHQECKTLSKWLRKQSMAIYDEQLNCLMTHAGVPPAWDLELTLACAYELETVLSRKNSAITFFEQMYGNNPHQWSEKHKGIKRLRFITNGLTRMRFCHNDGSLDLSSKSSPGKQHKGLIPWYHLSDINQQVHVVFGHWAALNGKARKHNIHAIDTGCVWGGKLTALRLEDMKRFSVKALRKWA
ncbi:MAG: symmetrical bis(5'-nucleosyl)-tetraphosphatase [Kangiellaceae bacterium]|nr:symmetrical bis(5'-nucleosyl)-tetraphosphatase [Kangiellaceae bacterium]